MQTKWASVIGLACTAVERQGAHLAVPRATRWPSKIHVVTLRALTSAFSKSAVWWNGMK